jgi:hypothetical protein
MIEIKDIVTVNKTNYVVAGIGTCGNSPHTEDIKFDTNAMWQKDQLVLQLTPTTKSANVISLNDFVILQRVQLNGLPKIDKLKLFNDINLQYNTELLIIRRDGY